jgi:hypothetical protein
MEEFRAFHEDGEVPELHSFSQGLWSQAVTDALGLVYSLTTNLSAT